MLEDEILGIAKKESSYLRSLTIHGLYIQGRLDPIQNNCTVMDIQLESKACFTTREFRVLKHFRIDMNNLVFESTHA